MKIWIDISNAPHIHFFKNIIKELEIRGHDVIVTARNYDSIREILNLNDIRYQIAGNHGGFSLKDKLVESSKRVLELTEIISKESPDLALYKHSVEASRVSYGLKIPSLCVIDNEIAESQNKLMLPLSTKIIAPEAIPLREITKYGVPRGNVRRFYGVCELAHVRDFVPDEKVIESFNFDRPLIVMRPEPIKANYYNGNRHKSIIRDIIANFPIDATFVVFPRCEDQKKLFDFENVIIPEKAMDSLSLIHYSDLVISAGGSMNREAIALEVPAISAFPGQILAVTQFLINLGIKDHSLDPKKIWKTAEEFMTTSYKKDVRNALKTMENPIDVVLEEIEMIED
jgi:predicted glycosyltransferase